MQRFLCAARGERKHVRIEQSFACAHLKEVSIECEERLRVKDKVNQIVKILTRNGILTEQISFKKIPRPEACKLILLFFMLHMSLIQKKKWNQCFNNYILSSYSSSRIHNIPAKRHECRITPFKMASIVKICYPLVWADRVQQSYISQHDQGATIS